MSDYPPKWMPRSLCRRFGVDAASFTAYVVVNVVIFVLRAIQFPFDPFTGRGVSIAKGSAEVIMVNCMLAIVSACHGVVDWLRKRTSPRSYSTQRPLEKASTAPHPRTRQQPANNRVPRLCSDQILCWST